MAKINKVAMISGEALDPAKREDLEPQVEAVVEDSDDNDVIFEDLQKLLTSKAVKVGKVSGRQEGLSTQHHNPGIDYTVGGMLDVRWVRNDDAHLSLARANHWVFPETISPRLKNLKHNELVLMVRLMEQSKNKMKYVEAESRRFEAETFDKTPGVSGLSEFEVKQSTKTAG